jgi:opacity protein-like surface antigen
MVHEKTKLALGIAAASITMVGALFAPQAEAVSKAQRQHQAEMAAVQTKVDYLEAQLRSMQAELSGLRTTTTQPSPDSQKVQELDQWMASVKAQPTTMEKARDNQLFFRGGYAHQNNDRGGTLDPTNLGALYNPDGLTVGSISDKDGWYFGAGFDFNLTNDVWGMRDDTEVDGELVFDYVEQAKGQPNGLSPQETATLASLGVTLPAANTQSATVNMLRLSASPKIKFMKHSKLRPWLIPVGFELSVISPPSDAITVLAPGMQFGAGMDYRIWKELFVGADARYHYAPGNVDGISINGVTAGGYIGIGF